ncbi:MAG TPA: ABC transporter substrate-binding protein [Herpetosiphonaceae bacterium]
MRLWNLLALCLLLAGCGAAAQTGAAPGGAQAVVTVAMPYIPNVQFAPFYMAKSKGYYAQAGLDVRFDYQYETESVQRVAQRSAQFGMAGGDSVLLARAQGLPIVTVATNSQRTPTVFFSKAELNIGTPNDLKGKRVGIPARAGASYIGLQSMLTATGIDERELDVREVGFAQVQALTENQIDAASGYANNEPVLLAKQGVKVNVLRVADYFALASDGIIAHEQLIAEQPELVRSFVQATLRGMADVIADPSGAFAVCLAEIPELSSADAATQDLQRAVLAETIPFWQSEQTAARGLGYTDAASWRATHSFLRQADLLVADVDVSRSFTNEFIKK